MCGCKGKHRPPCSLYRKGKEEFAEERRQRRAAGLVLKALRGVRDTHQKAWDSLMETGLGPQVSNLLDSLKVAQKA